MLPQAATGRQHPTPARPASSQPASQPARTVQRFLKGLDFGTKCRHRLPQVAKHQTPASPASSQPVSQPARIEQRFLQGLDFGAKCRHRLPTSEASQPSQTPRSTHRVIESSSFWSSAADAATCKSAAVLAPPAGVLGDLSIP